MFETISNLPLLSILLIAVAPSVWNGIGRFEYSTKLISRAFGSNIKGCYFLTILVMIVSRTRDLVFAMVVLQNRNQYEVPGTINFILGAVLFTAGIMLVVISNNKLGLLGTHMGDHFGIFLDAKITSFPFNILENPMYTGSFMGMLGFAIFFNSFTGIKLALFALLVYNLYSKLYEEKFTTYIYEQKAEREKVKQK